MPIRPYLNFNGQCEEAFKFYEKCLGGKIVTMMAHEGTPVAKEVPTEWSKKIMHACLSVEGDLIMGSDAPAAYYKPPQGFSVTLQINDPVKAVSTFNALAENGTVQMPIQETFWAERFGMVVDRFGTPWMINCEKAA